ncbi:MAG: hypothetical protein P9X26_07610 [Candidatus Stygibacter frigidus]|nr:hypothetical protein [Candidatus Stygibacter frigidus]
MKKNLVIVLFLLLGCLIWSATIPVTNSAGLVTALENAGDGDEIVLAAGTYEPVSTTLDVNKIDLFGTSHYNLSHSTIDITCFVVAVDNLTIRAATGAEVIIGTSDTGAATAPIVAGERSAAFVYKAKDVTFQDMTFQNLQYGIISDQQLNATYNSETGDFAALEVCDNTLISNINFNNLRYGIVFSTSYTDFCSYDGLEYTLEAPGQPLDYDDTKTWYDEERSYDEPGYSWTFTGALVTDCDFTNVYPGWSIMTNGEMDVVNNNFTHCANVYRFWGAGNGNPSVTGWNDDDLIIEYNTLDDIDGDLTFGGMYDYRYLTHSEAKPPTIWNTYINGSTNDKFQSASRHHNSYNALNNIIVGDNWKICASGSMQVYNETYNYIGNDFDVVVLNGGAADYSDCWFYSFGSASAVNISRLGDNGYHLDGDHTGNNANPADGENFYYTKAYGEPAVPATFTNCTFIHTNPTGTEFGDAAAIVMFDNAPGAFREYYGEAFATFTNCTFSGYKNILALNGGRPDNYTADIYYPETGSEDNVNKCIHDDGRLQVQFSECKFTNISHSIFDFTQWDQWKDTASLVSAYNCYFDGVDDPYTEFAFASDFIYDSSYYYDNDPVGHTYLPQQFQYAPYYTDPAMTTLAYPQVVDPEVNKSGNNYTVTWTDNANGDASYKVYAADEADPADWGTAVATIAAGDANSYIFDGDGVTTKYFKITTLIPNYGDGTYEGYAANTDGWTFLPNAIPGSTFSAAYSQASEYDNNVILGYQTVHLEDTGTGFTLIASAFDGGYTNIDGFGTDLDMVQGNTISEWDESLQDWLTDTWSGTTFNGGSGYNTTYNANTAYYVAIHDEEEPEAQRDVAIMGVVPESPVYDLITTETTDLNFIMLPLNSTITTAVLLGEDMGSNNTVMISQWDATNQSWASCVYISSYDAWVGSFDLTPGMPIVVGAEQNFTWPTQ